MYVDLVDQVTTAGYKTTLFTLQVGARGVPGFTCLAKFLKMISHAPTRHHKPQRQPLPAPSPSGAIETGSSSGT